MIEANLSDGLAARTWTLNVIVPVYNAEKTIEACIQSILVAIDGHDGVDVIFVDNGSTDATMDIIRRHGDRIRLVEAAEKGSYAARNAGAAAGSGFQSRLFHRNSGPRSSCTLARSM
jgi:glycosyltransferase involved in cell wall biosynthesis